MLSWVDLCIFLCCAPLCHSLAHAVLCAYVCIPTEIVNFRKAWGTASLSFIFFVIRVVPCLRSGEHVPFWVGARKLRDLVLRGAGRVESENCSHGSGKLWWWPGRQPNVTDPREATPTGGQVRKSVSGRVWRRAGEAPWAQQVVTVTKTGNCWPECFSAGCLSALQSSWKSGTRCPAQSFTCARRPLCFIIFLSPGWHFNPRSPLCHSRRTRYCV